MPMKGEIRTSEKAPASRLSGYFKRLVAASFIVGGTLFVLDQMGVNPSTLAQRPARRLPVQTVDNAECSFLKDPEQFRGAQQRHRAQISQSTEAFSGVSDQTATSLVPPQEIPRKNFIDEILFGKMQEDGIQSAPIASDAEYIRRVTLDLTGRIPSEAAVIAFLNSTDPNKRNALVDSLVGTAEFTDKWTQFFGDLFKNTSNSVNITRFRAGRDAFYNYIRTSIEEGKSYDRMVSEMIAARGDSHVNGEVNFIIGGNVTGGPAQDIYDGYAVHAATTFLGLSSMDCLLCHDGAGHLDAVNLWGAQVKRSDAWGMAAFFARTTRRTQNISQNFQKYIVDEATTGEYQLNTTQGNRSARQPVNGRNTAAPMYMFGGGALAQGETRRQAFARLLIADPQFARAAVNYIWEEMMVEALVSPSNTFDLARITPDAQMPDGWAMQAANPDLLQTLSQEFRQSGFNLRQLVATIAKSSAYQLSSQYPGEWRLEYVPYYARKYVRRLDAEEVHDALITATNLPNAYTMNVNGTNTTFLGYQLQDDLRVKTRDVIWAMQLPEPIEPISNGGVRAFLDSFLRGNRDQKLRTSEASIMQSLNMMNNGIVTGRTGQGNRITGVPNTPEIPSTVRKLLADTTLSNDQIVQKLYLTTLSRYPTDAEKAKLLPYFTSIGRQAATESIQWVLLNKVDFLFNY
ncbi:MAG: DUF1549 domain-containing protein [Blastocatellia bacterium]|nr:DUF1549 domain-containing protein [Blastocatellia bacterium]